MPNTSAKKMADLKRRVGKAEKALRVKRIKKYGWFIVYLMDGQYSLNEPFGREELQPITWQEVEKQARAKKQEIFVIEYTDSADDD